MWQHYRRCDEAGLLRIYTIRNGKCLVGYSIYTVVQNSHYGDSLQANNDIIYLTPELRGRMTGFKFIRWCDAQLKLGGVQRVTMHIKLAHNWGKALERQGYMAEEIIYAKRLDVE